MDFSYVRAISELIMRLREVGADGSGSLGHSKRVWDLPIIKTKNRSRNIESDVLGHSCDIPVESSSHEIVVAEDEGLLWVESGRNDVLHVVLSIALYSLDRSFWAAEDVLFIVCHHNDQWHVKDFLQVSGSC